MDDPLAIALFAIVGFALIWIAASYARYRVIYRYAAEDLIAARRDATKRSRSVLGGKAGEQLAPLVPRFCNRFDPSEARFIGAPIDYVVFDGIGSGELHEVVLVEVKTGGSRLNASERQVELAVAEGRVRFEVMRIP